MNPEEAIEAATEAYFEGIGDASYQDAIRMALEAAAPYLIREARAAELETAAHAAEGMHDPVAPDCLEWADWLRARAAAIRAGEA